MRTVKALEKRYGKERAMRRSPVALSNGEGIKLLPDSQNVLIKKVLDDLCSLYTPDGRVLYVSDTKKKWAYFDPDALNAIGVEIEEHGKMPDVVVHHVEKGWLVLIEAVTSHGPVNPKRRQELKELFAGSNESTRYYPRPITKKGAWFEVKRGESFFRMEEISF